MGLLSALTKRIFGKLLASSSKGHIKCVSLNIQLWQSMPTVVNINSNKTLYYPFNLSVNKWGKSCNTIDDPMLKNVFQKSEKYECLSIKFNSQGKMKQDFCLNMTDVSVYVHSTKVYVV